MAELDKGETVTLEEVMVLTLAKTDALTKLLIEKGLITDEEFQEEVGGGESDVSGDIKAASLAPPGDEWQAPLVVIPYESARCPVIEFSRCYSKADASHTARHTVLNVKTTSTAIAIIDSVRFKVSSYLSKPGNFFFAVSFRAPHRRAVDMPALLEEH